MGVGSADVLAAPFSFVVFGDLNGGGCSRNERAVNTVDMMAAETGVDFYISTGDLVDGYDTTSCFAASPADQLTGGGCGSTEPDPIRRAALDGNVKALLKPIKEDLPVKAGLSASFYPVVGNHDDNWGSGWYPDPCGTGICEFIGAHPDVNKEPWERYIDKTDHDPGNICSLDASTSTHSTYFYYSFEYQNSMFIVLKMNNDYYNMLSCNGHPDCVSYCTDPGLFNDPLRNSQCYSIHQYDWLRGKLAEAQAKGSEHIFVFAHAPLLGDGDGHNPTSGAHAIRELLESYNTDIFFNGHNHAYQRTYKVRSTGTGDPQQDASGTAYITVGVAGAAVNGAMPGTYTAASHQDWVSYGDSSGGTSYEDKMAGYMKVTVDGSSVRGEMKILGVSETLYPGRIVDSFQFGVPVIVDTDGDGIPDEVDREPGVPATPDCVQDAGGYVEIANKTYSTQITCTADTALATGVAVQVGAGAEVTYQSPKTRLFPGFSVANQGVFKVRSPVTPAPVIAGCQILPDDNMWNTPVTGLPLHPNSDAFIASIGGGEVLHPDFGTQWAGNDIGIPFDVIPAGQAVIPVRLTYWDESDRQDKSCNPANDNDLGCYPIPPNVTIEGQPANSGDRHALLLQQDTCMLYELFAADKSSGSWLAGSGAIWDLSQNQQRPLGWTSADAAGLPILPGLLRYDEVYSAGEVNHAIRITMDTVRSAYILPASHSDGQGGTNPNTPPMGLRMRLKADFDISGFNPINQKILRALKKYGVVIADTGSDMYLSGQHHDNWDDAVLHELQNVTAADFEALYTGDAIPYP
jgi:hypothetical protein